MELASCRSRRIEAELDADRAGPGCSGNSLADPSGELDAGVDTGGSGCVMDAHPGDGVAGGIVAIARRGERLIERPHLDVIAVRSRFGWLAPALLHPPLLQRMAGRRSQAEHEGGLQRNEDRPAAPIDKGDRMLDRPGPPASAGLPPGN